MCNMIKQMPKNITLKFISEQAGYSPSTVSRVMNGNAREYRISEKAEKKILKIAEKYGYKPNPIAVNLRVKKSFTIGLIIPTLENPFFVNVTSILNRELSKRGYNIILTESDDDPTTEGKMINRLLERNIDGLLIIPCKESDQNAGLLENTYDEGIPVLCIDRYIKNSKVPYITTDNEKGAYEGVEYLINKGHRKIACIQGLKGATPTVDRKNGYLEALEAHGLDPFYIGGDAFSIDCGYREANIILNKEEKPSAIFAMSGTIALGVMKAAAKKNLAIPGDISLLGFDDSIFLDYLTTPLTTIAQPVKKISEIAVNAIMEHIDGAKSLNEWMNKMLDTRLIKRKSVAKT